MENSKSCKACGKRNLVPDDETGNLVCTSCGVVQDFENFQAHIGGITGPAGTNVRIGTAGSGSVYSYKDTKIYEAKKLIEDYMFKLGLSASRSNEVKGMVEKITEGEYGQGRWFPVFVGACAYVVMRKDNKMLPIVEVANLVGCDSYELGRMINRVIDFLDLKLPEFDIVNFFERSIWSCSSFGRVTEDVIRRMLKQGVFLVQCSMKWFLTTGRRPVPIVAAVLVFVAELNQVEVKIEEVAKELHVCVRTCNKRYKELAETLVKVAQGLPWGKDITVKNILKNAQSVIQYMELKSMSKSAEKSSLEFGIELNDLVGDCLSKKGGFGFHDFDTKNELQYFELEHSVLSKAEGLDDLQISHECLAMIYSKYLDEIAVVKSVAKREKSDKRKQRRGYDLNECREWWTGKSELSKRLLLKQIMEKDVGLNANPPCFDRGQLDNERRREKIKAAKLRIQRIMHPFTSGSGDGDDHRVVNAGKRKRKMPVEIDWEDFIIETLLLHQVREDEIEKGHYNVLLELHVFNH